jgi:hypothetical protein
MDVSLTWQLQGWEVLQVTFIAGARSLNEEKLRETLQVFKVPQAGIDIETIRSRLAMNILEITQGYV